MKKIIVAMLTMGIMLSGIAISSAWAYSWAISFNSPGDEYSLPHTLGFEFKANVDLMVTNLGFYDSGQNGLSLSHQVGIFNMAGVLLTSTTVYPRSRFGPPESSLDGFFRYEPITPIQLTAGTNYVIAAVIGDGDDYTFFANGTEGTRGFTVDPAITYIKNRDIYTGTDSGHSNQLIFPTDTLAGYTAFFGPNFTAQPVPVPASLLLLGSGLLGLIGFRRLRRS